MGITDLFATSTKSNTNQQQQGQSNTTNNLFGNPLLQNQMGNYFNQFSPSSISSVYNPANMFQYGAANNQMGATANLNPGFNSAAGYSQTGLSPTAYQPYMSQYTQSVINPTLDKYNLMNQQAISTIGGNQAMRGAGLNSNAPNAKSIYYQNTLPGQQAQVASLYDTGYNNAVNNAAKSAGISLQGAGTLGSLTGAQTGANTGLNNIGASIWGEEQQNLMNPFQLTQMGLQGAQTYGNLAGTNTNSSGTSNSQTQSQQNPGFIQSALGLAGLGNWALGGMGIGGGMGTTTQGSPAAYGSLPWQNPFGWSIGQSANGGRINGYSDGGTIAPFQSDPQDDVHGRFQKAFDMLNNIRSRASGGEVDGVPSLGSFTVPGYAEGGAPEFNPWNAQYGTPTYANDPDAALSFNGINPYDLVSDSKRSPAPSYMNADPPIQGSQQGSPNSAIATQGGPAPTPDQLAQQGAPQQAAPQLGGPPQQQQQQPDPTQQQQGGPQQPTNKAATFDTNLGLALQSGLQNLGQPPRAPAGGLGGDDTTRFLLSGSPISNMAGAITQSYQDKMKEWEAKKQAAELLDQIQRNAASLTGTYNGAPTMAGQKLPLELEGLKAHTIAGQKEIDTNKNQIAKDLAAQQQYAKSMEHINMAEGAGVWTPEEANGMRQRAYELYQRSRGQIQDVGKPPQTPVSRAWVPGQGVAPRPAQ